MRWSFFIPGIPVAQGRPRATVTRGGHVRVYDPAKSRIWKEAIFLAAVPYRPLVPSQLPCRLTLHILLPRPRRLPKRVLFPVARPDTSNYLKGIEDALTHAGFWADDSQVIDVSVSKRFGAPTGVQVMIEEVEPC